MCQKCKGNSGWGGGTKSDLKELQTWNMFTQQESSLAEILAAAEFLGGLGVEIGGLKMTKQFWKTSKFSWAQGWVFALQT